MSHLELEIFQYWSNFTAEVSNKTEKQTYKKFKIIWKLCNNIPGMSPKIFRKISHLKLEKSLYLSNFGKEVNKQAI